MLIETTSFSPRQNRILGKLSDTDYECLLPHLELVLMPLGMILCDTGEQLTHGYFPIDSTISLLCDLEDGFSMAAVLIGNEGVFGLQIMMGNTHTPSRVVVQNAGYGYRVKAKVLIDQFYRIGSFMKLTLLYAQALITQMTQIAVCNRRHSIEQQFCRWILLTIERTQMNHLRITQESISHLLGVRRESVTEAATNLQRLEIIAYTRGSIYVLNQTALRRRSCECYQVVKSEFDRLMPNIVY